MSPSIFISLVQNAAILLVSVLFYEYLWVKDDSPLSNGRKILTGVAVAVVGLLLMINPWVPYEGLFFDTRSVLLSITGLYLGVVPTMVAMFILSIYRVFTGGSGMLMGVTVIFASGFIGLLWSRIRPSWKDKTQWSEFLLFGTVVYLAMMLCSLLLPREQFISINKSMFLSALFVYPFVTMVTGMIIQQGKESRKDKKRLEESRALYASFVNHLPACVYRKDSEGRYDFVNERFCTLKGLKNEEIIGKNQQELDIYENKKRLEKGYSTLPGKKNPDSGKDVHHEWIMRHGMPIVLEEAYLLADGKIGYFQVAKSPVFNYEGKVTGSQGMMFDITSYKNTEEELLYEKYLLKTFMDNTPDTIYFKDIESRFQRVNKSQLDFFGISDMKEVYGKSDFDFLPPENAKKSFNDEQMVIRTGKSIIYNQEKITKKDGKEIWINYSKFPLREKSGEIVGTFGFSHDITSQKELEADLVSAKLKAEESDRLKTAFLHNISHEIRTPMNAIVGFSGFLKDPDIDDEKKRHCTDIIVQSSNQLMTIIDDIVKISSIEAGQEKLNESNVQLNSILEYEYEQFSPKANEKGLDFQMMPGLKNDYSEILTDETKLMQVLTNLMANAFKFTSSGHIYSGYKLKKGFIEFFVEDTGIGIQKDMQKKIFQRFTQVDSSLNRQYGGSGLGLSISKAYVNLMGGEMWIESEKDNGSCFYFTIPYRRTKTDVASSKENPDEGEPVAQDNNLKILVAEDEEINYMLVRELLRPFNAELVRAVNGKEAVEVALNDETFNLVLMDLKMPVMDGFEASRLIKENRPDLEIIALTAYSMESDKIKALSCGCSDVIVKPLQKEILYSKISKKLSKL